MNSESNTTTARPISKPDTVSSTDRADTIWQGTPSSGGSSRRSLFRSLGIASSLLVPGAGALAATVAQSHNDHDRDHDHDNDGHFTAGDIAILRFLAWAELIEADLWTQYTELAVGNPAYQQALMQLDGDMIQYISDNTDDENSHAEFLNAFLISVGSTAVNLDVFRTLRSSTASGAGRQGRLTNLTDLTVDTSWYLRYRSTGNPDLGTVFPQFINITGVPAIPLRDNYNASEIQAIANTAGFHFATIEQGGASLYASLVPKASQLDMLRLLVGIGGVEVNHFAVWHDKAGNAPPVTVGNLVFPDLKQFNGDESRQTNLIMPEPCQFLRKTLPECSVIRPASTANAGAVATVTSWVDSGLFAGQSQAFFSKLNTVATAADAARRQV